MKRWLLLIGLTVLVLAALSILGYTMVRSSLAEELDKAENLVLAKDNVHSVHDVYYYNGEETIYTVNAGLADGSDEWFFLNDNSITSRLPSEESISLKEAEEVVLDRFDRQTIRSIKPGMEDGEPLYEVTFKNDSTLHYYYLSMEDGAYIKRYSIRQNG
ncbi:PepSY domain-containing protein [Salibacterium sp. K-3]